MRSACGAIEDLSEIAIPLLKRERVESNPPGLERPEKEGERSAPSSSGPGTPKDDKESKPEPDRPPGDLVTSEFAPRKSTPKRRTQLSW